MEDHGDKHPEMNRRVTDLTNDLLECKTEVGQELEKGNKRMNGLGVQIDEVAAAVNDLAESIEQLLEIFETSKRAFVAMGWLGKAVKWIVMTGGGLAVIWYFLKTGHWNK